MYKAVIPPYISVKWHNITNGGKNMANSKDNFSDLANGDVVGMDCRDAETVDCNEIPVGVDGADGAVGVDGADVADVANVANGGKDSIYDDAEWFDGDTNDRLEDDSWGEDEADADADDWGDADADADDWGDADACDDADADFNCFQYFDMQDYYDNGDNLDESADIDIVGKTGGINCCCEFFQALGAVSTETAHLCSLLFLGMLKYDNDNNDGGRIYIGVKGKRAYNLLDTLIRCSCANYLPFYAKPLINEVKPVSNMRSELCNVVFVTEDYFEYVAKHIGQMHNMYCKDISTLDDLFYCVVDTDEFTDIDRDLKILNRAVVPYKDADVKKLECADMSYTLGMTEKSENITLTTHMVYGQYNVFTTDIELHRASPALSVIRYANTVANGVEYDTDLDYRIVEDEDYDTEELDETSYSEFESDYASEFGFCNVNDKGKIAKLEELSVLAIEGLVDLYKGKDPGKEICYFGEIYESHIVS